MGIEIERRFLVDPARLEASGVMQEAGWAATADRIVQGYLSEDPWVRVRQYNELGGLLTIKGRGTVSRPEFNLNLSGADARDLLEMCKFSLAKTRHYCTIGDRTWEVDCFLGPLEGLWLAEVELPSVDHGIIPPDWAVQEVTTVVQYTNAFLAKHGLPLV